MAGPQDLIAQLQALQAGGQGMSTPPPGNAMAAAIARMQGGGGDGMLNRMAMAQPGSGRMATMMNGGMDYPNAGELATGPQSGRSSPATDGELAQLAEANQGVRGNLPILADIGGYTGYGEEMTPMPEGRQTPMPSDFYEPNVGARGAPGQAIMGAYLNRNKGAPSTEEELEDVQKRMGGVTGPNPNTRSGDPSMDGNFPSQAEIDGLSRGTISVEEFDAKWGKGAAKEMMQNIAGDQEDDEGDHEYR